VIDPALDDGLDRWSAALFGDEQGAARLQPLLELWEREVGAVRGEDPELESLHAVRVDWALCDALAPGATRPWCERDDAEGVLEPTLRDALRGSWVGLFEVWPRRGGAGAWLRDRLGGACATLQGPIDVAIADDGPSALWELRVVMREHSLHACRRPIVYPLALVELLGEGAAPRAGEPARLLQVLRRTRLWHLRAPRLDPRSVFGEALRNAAR
jgi:hypothetical protein